MKSVYYVIRQLSKDDPDFTIDLLLETIEGLEKELEDNQKTVNELNHENKVLKQKLKEETYIRFDIAMGMGDIHDN